MESLAFPMVFSLVSKGVVVEDALHPELELALKTAIRKGIISNLDNFIRLQNLEVSRMHTRNSSRNFRTAASYEFENCCPVCGIAFQTVEELDMHKTANQDLTPHMVP